MKIRLDEDILSRIAAAIIKGWNGLKYKYLEEFLLVDVSQLNLEDELEYTQDNAELINEKSGRFRPMGY